MTDGTMSKALEAAKDAFWHNWPIGSDETGERWSKHPDDVSEQEQNKCLQAAISALRPAPKLSEEEQVRVVAIKARHEAASTKLHWSGADALEINADRAFLLSLIDTLTEAG